MKKRLFLVLTVLTMGTTFLLPQAFANSKQAKRIWLLDTTEYDTVIHRKGKWNYLNKVAQILNRFPVKIKSLPDRSLDAAELQVEIESPHWARVLAEVDKICLNVRHREACNQLADAREELFDYVKANPEDP